MLGILIMIGIGRLFLTSAKKNDLNKALWTILGVASYFVGQVLAGVFIGLFNPRMLDDMMSITIIGLISGIAGVVITWFIMQSVIKNKNSEQDTVNDDLLDDNPDTFYHQKESDF